MSFQQFSFPSVLRDLGLTLTETDLFAAVGAAAVRPDFLALISGNANLAGAINTEKARSESSLRLSSSNCDACLQVNSGFFRAWNWRRTRVGD